MSGAAAMPGLSGWMGLGHIAHLGAAFICVLLAVWLAQRGARGAAMGRAEIGGLVASAVWSLLIVAAGVETPVAALGEAGRDLAWLGATYALFARDGRHASVRPVRPLVAALGLVALLATGLTLAGHNPRLAPPAVAMVRQLAVTLRLLVAIGALVLVHNLYAGAMAAQRVAVRWTCVALAVLWGYDLNYFTIAYLGGGAPVELTALRGAAQVAMACLMGVGALRSRVAQKFSPSRAVAFQSLSLLVIAIYMIVMAGAARSLVWFGGGAAWLVQIGFVLVTTVLAIAVLPSGKLRGWLKVTVTKHLFQHRYDYRAEWQRFTQTMGRAGPGAPPLHERVVQAVADITDSTRGLLLTPDDHGHLTLAARWQWRTLEVPAEPMPAAAVRFFEAGGFIVDLDEVRGGVDHGDEAAIVPAWLRDEPGAWALVPLIHFDRLAGLVVLGRPPLARQLDWEDFDLLRVVGRQLASYLAEHGSQRALLEAARFDEFNRRIAFVMHDIKNLASQLTLLARNAERHAENPAFRADMLVTLRNAADKLNALLARLSGYGTGGVAEPVALDLAEIAGAIAARYPTDGDRRVIAVAPAPCRVLGSPEPLEQVLQHLVQNALEASAPGMPVMLQVGAQGGFGTIEVADCGTGMSAEFIRNGLFKPFVSTKSGGFGIGAFEARELVRAMHGRLEVASREGIGSRFTVRLPLAAAPAQQKVA